jgi:hypothetical protein
MDLRYPIGQFQFEGSLTDQQRKSLIDQIAEAPACLRAAVGGLSDEQLDTPYRPGGWTVRQVAHHLPDSHMNSYIRFRLAVTEEAPTIRAYYEARWAELEDARAGDVELSLSLLEALHKRWVVFLRSLSSSDYSKTFMHPELGAVSLDKNLSLYAWHGRHHVAQITSLRDRMGWK